ncbi:hypothetical protein BGZ65_010112, partial [Modicella reniformis]
MTPYLDKKRTTIHIDGEPSIQKSNERKHRQEQLDTQLEKLTKQTTDFCERKRGSPAKLFRKCRDVYRPPPCAISNIAEGLRVMGWEVCLCPFQADTHIGELCQKIQDKGNLAVVSGDSDLMVYEGVSSVTMPVGKSHELKTFSKAKVLQELGLPSSRHLQLAAILTKNDYFGGIRTFGISRNAELVRTIHLDQERDMTNSELVAKFMKAIELYLAHIKSPEGISTADYCNAISAFVLCQETWDVSAKRSAATADAVAGILRRLEDAKLRRRGLLQQAPAAPSNIDSLSSNKLIVAAEPSQDRSMASQATTSSPKQDQRQRRSCQKSLKEKKKLESWRKARFKSPNLDKNPRYSAHVVKDVTKACSVDEAVFSKLTESIPRARKPKKEPEKEPDKEAENKPPEKKLKKPRKGTKKGSTNRRKKDPQTEPEEEKKRVVSDAKVLKKLFGRSFKTVTLTLGCLTGTLRRATSMEWDEARQVADRVNKAGHILSKARILVYKGLELFTYHQVTSKVQSISLLGTSESNSAMDTSESNSAMDTSESNSAMDTSESNSAMDTSESNPAAHPPSSTIMDPLDLLLDKQHGQTL